MQYTLRHTRSCDDHLSSGDTNLLIHLEKYCLLSKLFSFLKKIDIGKILPLLLGFFEKLELVKLWLHKDINDIG